MAHEVQPRLVVRTQFSAQHPHPDRRHFAVDRARNHKMVNHETTQALKIATLTVAFDAALHALFTEPFEIPTYFVVGFIGAFIITKYLLPNNNALLAGSLFWAAWKGFVYGVLLPLGLKVSVATQPYTITTLGSSNPTFQFVYWAVTHAASFAAAYYIIMRR